MWWIASPFEQLRPDVYDQDNNFLTSFLKETPRLGVMVALFLLSQVSNKHVQTLSFLPVLVSLSDLSVYLSICYPAIPLPCPLKP